jgi:hypothetical protein
VLADQLAEAVADFGPAVVSVLSIDRLRWEFPRLARGGNWFGKGSDFLNRADADAVGLAQSSVDRPGFGHTHFGAMDQGRDIGRIGITVADEAPACLRLENSSSEYPPKVSGIARFQNWAAMDASTVSALGNAKQSGMCNIPTPIEVSDVSGCD